MTSRIFQIKSSSIFKRVAVLAFLLVAALGCWSSLYAQSLPWSQRVANTAIARWPAESFLLEESTSTKGAASLLLNGMDAVWYSTADGAYYQYEKQAVDALLSAGGIARTNAQLPVNIDFTQTLLRVYRVTQDARYFKQIVSLQQHQFALQQGLGDESSAGEIYATAPFFAEYAAISGRSQEFANVTKQFSADTRRAVLSAHANQAEPRAMQTRALAWYMMALVDTLPHYPLNDPGRAALLGILKRAAAKVVHSQDLQTGIWHATFGRTDSAEDATATCMLLYVLQKGIRLGYLQERDAASAERAWREIVRRFIRIDTSGNTTVEGKAGTDDAGSDPARVGAFLLASTEMERSPLATLARGQTVLVDAWFNAQQRTIATGQKEYFHYKWNDFSDSGYSLFGSIFTSFGAALDTLPVAPTLDRLKKAQYYIIVSPDIPAKNPHPHYVRSSDADQVTEWVKWGGVLILMENDPPNADIDHLNLIADRFGMHFNNVLSHHVVGDDVSAGQIAVNGTNLIFHKPHTLYMKDTCTLTLQASAKPLLADKDGPVIATARYGRGTVVAVVDPWLYNEYTDDRKSAPLQDNYAAGEEFVRWLVRQRHCDDKNPAHQ